jgi:sigma-54 dependent transcriptional regulator, acetoin dehydrogenase operon transcriptional activator AcoR
MFRIMFCSPDPCENGRVAAAIARTMASENWEISYRSVGKEKSQIPETLELYKKYGLEFNKIIPFTEHETKSIRFQVVISIGKAGSTDIPSFSGMPVHIHWTLPELSETPESERATEFKLIYHELYERLSQFFKEGTLDSIVQSRVALGSLIDNLTDGVMAHDENRKIFVFNKAAEIITGYLAEDVIGRDCHIIFPGRFCGGDCSFCKGEDHKSDRLKYPHSFIRTDSTIRDLEMSVVSLRTPEEKILGALVIFRDMTELNKLRRTVYNGTGFHGIIGQHESMQKVFTSIEELSKVNVPILIQGESGTGKEMVARALHILSTRANQPFVPVNCGALPEGTLESELFGHVRGAFTGAIRDRKGRFELADKGTLFLDEIGEIVSGIQVKLLRVLQEKSFVPVGGEKTTKVSVRVICATNKDLKEATKQGQFREDLFYRLAVVPIYLPPLRERKSDIPLLVDFYLKRFSDEMGITTTAISTEAMEILMSYLWPGNVRELRNAVQYGIIKSHGKAIEAWHLPQEVTYIERSQTTDTSGPGRPSKLTYKLATETLRKYAGNKAKAARDLGVSRTTLYRALQKEE